jgi:hypothetical protein
MIADSTDLKSQCFAAALLMTREGASFLLYLSQNQSAFFQSARAETSACSLPTAKFPAKCSIKCQLLLVLSTLTTSNQPAQKTKRIYLK